MMESIKERIKKNPIGGYLVNLRKKALYQYYCKKYTDEEFVRILYRKANHEELNLENPQLFTEKLQWLKLYYRDNRITQCSDKYEVKNYLKEQGFSDIIIPTIAQYENVGAINPDSLPDEFIMKASHGSGWNILCRDKQKVNWRYAKKTMNIWLHENLYIYGREWNYLNQKSRILVEPLIDEKPLVDYKFMCFNGKVKALQINHDEGQFHYVDFYDDEWHFFPDMSCGVEKHCEKPIDKPQKFEEMKELAEKLAEPFPFVRVDLYLVKDKIYFGEMTFFPGSGFWKITPKSRNQQFGSWLKLPPK